MKKIILSLAVLAATLVVSCKKADTKVIENDSITIVQDTVKVDTIKTDTINK